VHYPNPVKGNKPITVGHQYSSLVLLPEAEASVSSSWVVPLMARRVTTSEDKELVGSPNSMVNASRCQGQTHGILQMKQ
jgi:hypothetical protein